MQNTKRLYRSRTNKMIGGVAGGLADYFNVDVILMRLLFVVIFFAGGGGILIYIILWIIMPLQPYNHVGSNLNYQQEPGVHNEKKSEVVNNNNKSFIVGVSLIILGLLFLFNTMFPQFHFKQLWPLVLVLVGAMIILNDSGVKGEGDTNQNAQGPSTGEPEKNEEEKKKGDNDNIVIEK